MYANTNMYVYLVQTKWTHRCLVAVFMNDSFDAFILWTDLRQSTDGKDSQKTPVELLNEHAFIWL